MTGAPGLVNPRSGTLSRFLWAPTLQGKEGETSSLRSAAHLASP